MSSPFISQILMFGGNYAPKNYALCNGQLLSIQQNAALFSLLGTTYGGNGTTNFALPNLQSSLPVSFGQGPGLSFYNLGQTGGSPNVTLTQATVPPHIHNLMCSTSTAATTSSTISNTLLPGSPPASNAHLYATPPGNPPLQPQALGAASVSTVGNNQGHTNLMPSLCITFAIALTGVFPSRN
jgi:microcystin-dependent protein